jgi:hypothetical protein
MPVFSGTGSSYDIAGNAAKCALIGLETSYFSDINHLMVEKGEFEQLILVILCQQITCFHELG